MKVDGSTQKYMGTHLSGPCNSGAPLRPFWILQEVRCCRQCERVSSLPICWYYNRFVPLVSSLLLIRSGEGGDWYTQSLSNNFNFLLAVPDSLQEYITAFSLLREREREKFILKMRVYTLVYSDSTTKCTQKSFLYL